MALLWLRRLNWNTITGPHIWFTSYFSFNSWQNSYIASITAPSRHLFVKKSRGNKNENRTSVTHGVAECDWSTEVMIGWFRASDPGRPWHQFVLAWQALQQTQPPTAIQTNFRYYTTHLQIAASAMMPLANTIFKSMVFSWLFIFLIF